MVLRMKNFNIFGVHWKIRLLGGFTKNQYRGGNCLKRGAWTVCRFNGGLGEKEGVVFLMGGLTPQCTLCKVFEDLCFFMFSGLIKRDYREEMGSYTKFCVGYSKKRRWNNFSSTFFKYLKIFNFDQIQHAI